MIQWGSKFMFHLFFQDKSILAFVRLTEATNLGDLTEVPIPVRFLLVVVGPQVRIDFMLLVSNMIKELFFN